jgi:transcriptional regulator with XRE-family HTH domain
MNELPNWLNRELQKRGWSMRELGRRSGVSQAQISNVINGIARPSADFCIKVAKAFRLPPETVLRRAGILPALTTIKEERETLLHYFDQLSSADQNRLLAIARTLATERVEYKIEPRDASSTR